MVELESPKVTGAAAEFIFQVAADRKPRGSCGLPYTDLGVQLQRPGLSLLLTVVAGAERALDVFIELSKRLVQPLRVVWWKGSALSRWWRK